MTHETITWIATLGFALSFVGLTLWLQYMAFRGIFEVDEGYKVQRPQQARPVSTAAMLRAFNEQAGPRDNTGSRECL